MTRPSLFKISGITIGLASMVLLFQNCSNKDNINLEAAIKYAQQHTTTSQAAQDPKDPILVRFTNNQGGNSVDVYSSGTIYASVSSAGDSGMVCSETAAQRHCLTSMLNTSVWVSLYANGWTNSSSGWTKNFTVGTDVTAGTYRFYFARPKVDDITRANNFGSIEFQVQ